MKAVFAGGSGFLGQSLARVLSARGDEIIVLSRGDEGTKDGVKYVKWDGKTFGPWAGRLEGADCIFNFTGKSVNCVY
ncbi:MAG TPA: TIGR01777 family protein, partial [Blastocatellia bacterium]